MKKYDPEKLRTLYCDKQLTSRQVGRILGFSHRSILNWLKKEGISRRPAKRRKNPLPVSKEKLTRLYITEKKSTTQIGKEINRSSSTVSLYLKYYDVPARKSGWSAPWRVVKVDLKPIEVLGYFCGLVIGDGCICITKHGSYLIDFASKDRELIDLYVKTVKKINAKLSPHAYLKTQKGRFGTCKLWRVTFGSKVLYNALRPYKKEDYHWGIPKFLKTKKSLKGFISGIFDADGSVWYEGRNKHINLASKHNDGLHGVKKILADIFNIKSRVTFDTKNNEYKLFISRNEDIKKFAREINFKLSRKRKKVAEIVNGIKERQKHFWSEEEVRFLLENMNTMTYREIGKKIGRTEGTVKQKAYALKRK